MTPVWRRLLGLVAPQRAGIGAAIALQVATVAAGVGLMGTSAWLISKAALHPSIAVLQVAIVGVRFFGISRGAFRYLERLASHEVTLRMLARLRVRVYQALEPLAPARLVTRRSGDLAARLVGDVDVLDNLYVRIIGPTGSAAVVVLLMAAFLAPAGWTIAAMAVVGLLAAGVGAPVIAERLGRHPSARTVEARAIVSATLVDIVQGLADLVAFGRQAEWRERVRADSRNLAAAQQRAAEAASFGTALGGLAADLAGTAILLSGAAAVSHGTLDGTQLAVLVLTSVASFEAVAPLAAAYQSLGATSAAARRLFELEDEAAAVDSATIGVEPAAVPPGRGATLETCNLSFTYPGEDEPALDGISLRLAPGRCVAVVGASGSGKSTLAHLLLRFWDAQAGAILIDGRDARSASPQATRAAFAVVPQPAFFFTGTIRDNLLIGRPDARDAELVGALETAGLGAVAAALPEGLGTWIGENGLRLSGGERQRLALARALLKEAPFLVLDEPTANVDPETERDLLAAFRREADTRGVLLITHRLAGLACADEILVLRRGREIQRGTFDALATGEGWFRSALALERASRQSSAPGALAASA